MTRKKLTTKEYKLRLKARKRRVLLRKASSKGFKRPEGFDDVPEATKEDKIPEPKTETSTEKIADKTPEPKKEAKPKEENK
ncbi:MAG: hypothetical protein U9R42_14015, partial [Bacteroidota bacterium]|nr:hypothetical protein [Bacteroidota bacterium]